MILTGHSSQSRSLGVLRDFPGEIQGKGGGRPAAGQELPPAPHWAGPRQDMRVDVPKVGPVGDTPHSCRGHHRRPFFGLLFWGALIF